MINFEKLFNDLKDPTLMAETLTNLKTEIEQMNANIENKSGEIENLKKENDALRATNTNLYLQVVKDPVKVEEEDTRDDYERLLDKIKEEQGDE